jgi:hypothetical protein
MLRQLKLKQLETDGRSSVDGTVTGNGATIEEGGETAADDLSTSGMIAVRHHERTLWPEREPR